MNPYIYEIVEDTFAWLNHKGVEWARAWDKLEKDPINYAVGTYRKAAACPDSGETWQYMGTVLIKQDGGMDWVHEFRHRHHPVSKQRQVVRVSVLCTP